MNEFYIYLENVKIIDWIVALIGSCSLIIALLFFEHTTKKHRFKLKLTRKYIHFITGIFVVICIVFLQSNLPLLLASLLFLLIIIWALKNNKLTSIHENTESLGTVFFPLSIILLLLLLWPSHKHILIISVLVLSVSDALAALIGQKYAKIRFIILTEEKSIPGTITMFLSSSVIIFSVLLFTVQTSLWQITIISIMTGFVITAAELISSRGSDNISVPIISALFIHAYLNSLGTDQFLQLTIGVVLSLFTALLSFKLKILSMNGAIFTFLLGSIIFGLGGLSYATPILVFFLSSSLISIIGKRRKKQYESYYEKGSVRDIYQVFANGGVAGILVIFDYLINWQYFYPLYLASIAAACADTWATEIGVFSKHKPRLITTFKKVNRGSSGAISILGSIAAMAGSFVIVLTGTFFFPVYTYNNISILIFIIVVAGLIASFFDSFLGATIQAQYKCKNCNKIIEKKIHCKQDTVLLRGKKWLNNDVVNIFSIIFSVLFLILLIILID